MSKDHFFYEYWIGKDIDLDKYWNAYREGVGYERKFQSLRPHVFEITFEKNAKDQPLYNLEAVYKTLKAYYHDLKKDCLPSREYDEAGPLYIYEINRGSGIWTWLAELPYLLFFGTTLEAEKIKGQKLDNIDKKLKILKEYFGEGNIRLDLYEAFVKAKTPKQMEQAMQNLFQERIKSIKISKSPIITSVEEAKQEMIELKEIFKSIG